jgi:hypothetical protein
MRLTERQQQAIGLLLIVVGAGVIFLGSSSNAPTLLGLPLASLGAGVLAAGLALAWFIPRSRR